MDMASIRLRLRSLREQRSLSQETVAKALGFKDRQTLSDLELGDRRISPQELIAASKFFGVRFDYFTDPFELAGEGRFSWRQKNATEEALNNFEAKAGSWLAAYRHLSKLQGKSVNSQMLRVALDEKSTFEDASLEGEAVGDALGLGDIPALKLASVMEEKLDTLVLYVDTVEGVSGAACQLRQLNTVLINRNEPTSRQVFDLAHEFFHLLTWESMPPKRIESDSESYRKENRVEQLAENFASGILMPERVLNKIIAHTPLPDEASIPEWLIIVADTLKVSPTALMWRLVNIKALPKATAGRIRDKSLFSAFSRKRGQRPPRFSKKFVGIIGWGIESGHVSVRRTASLLAMSIDDLAALFEEHNLVAPFAL
ncbi:helix-turn-helix domain-containing protein [Oxalobacteraceae sp. CFBP 8755]|nr:helix-turn-helix domain-containing protein [Oxalobacteraceae sp. CFBP 8755]